MAYQDPQLLPHSYWSSTTDSTALQQVSEPFTPPFAGTPVMEPEPEPEPGLRSRFSMSTTDESLNPGFFPHVNFSYRRPRLSPISRAYAFGRNSRRRTNGHQQDTGLQAIDELEWPMPPPTKPTLPQLTPDSLEVPASDMSRARAFLFVAVICMAQFCAQAGIGQTLAIVHAIGPHYGIHNASDLTWVLAGYCLAMGSLILAAGRLGETYGRKRVLMIGFAWSAVWAAVSGAAFYSTYGFFVAARALQGLGIALSLPNGFALLEAAYQSSRRRALVLTLFATMAPAGLLVGAAGAGALALVWWPWAYWVFALALCIVAVVGRLVIPDLAQGGGTPRSIRAFVTELDVPGVVAGVLALALISFGWNQGPLVGWREPYVWVSLILGVLLLAVFVAVECYYAPKPLVPFMALSSDVALVLVSVACGWSCFGIWASYTWQFALDIRRASPLLTIAYFSPIILVSCLAAATTGPMIRRLGPFIVLLISLLGFTVGSLLVATAPAVQSYWAQLFLCILITSWSMVISLPAATFILSTAVDKTQQGTMASMITTAMYYSISLGLGIARNVEFGVNGGGLTRHHRLNGYRGGLYTGVCLAGIGTLVCLAFLMKVHRRNRKRSYNYHGSMEEHNQI